MTDAGRPWLIGVGVLLAIGLPLVYLAIVVPLSLAPSGPPPPAQMIGLGLLAHALFGVALAWTAARVLRGVR